MRKMKLAVVLVLGTLVLGAAAWADGMHVVHVPIAGAYMEPALGGPVAYIGIVTFYWTPGTDSGGNPIWNRASVLDGEAWSLANGVKFRVYSYSEGSYGVLRGGGVTQIEPFWAVGVPGLAVPAFRGALTLTVELPKEAALPSVSGVSLAMR